ncbi:MAG: homoserine O-acetyltransferase [Bacteroidota bacterium]
MENKLLIDSEFQLESGKSLPNLEIVYHTYGKLNAEKSNVIWVCHALTANSDVLDWWAGLFGESCLFNPEEHFIVCVNNLSSCYGTSGPLSINPHTKEPFYHDFPLITIRDIVAVHEIIRKHLGIEQIKMLIGGSIGGMQVLEWAISSPGIFETIVPIATSAEFSAWGRAFNESQRMAIEADQTWKERKSDAGLAGLKAARSIALLTYRNYESYNLKQAEDDDSKIDYFKASSYQNYQGEKLIKRFNAFSYYMHSKAVDSHNVGRNRGGVLKALSQIKAKTLIVGISSDVLFPIEEQRFLAEHIPNAIIEEIDSIFGHDGFLVELEKLKTILTVHCTR